MKWLVYATIACWAVTLWGWLGVFAAKGWATKLQRTVPTTAVTVVAVLLGGLLTVLQTSYAFSGEALVATVTTKPVRPTEFELSYVPAGQPVSAATLMRLRGDQWAIMGGVIKWHPWLTALGVSSYHKPIAVRGQYADLHQEQSHLPSIYPLATDMDHVWEAVYWLDPYLPFIEAVYGSSAYAYAEPNATYRVSVTPSGYVIKRVSRQLH